MRKAGRQEASPKEAGHEEDREGPHVAGERPERRARQAREGRASFLCSSRARRLSSCGRQRLPVGPGAGCPKPPRRPWGGRGRRRPIWCRMCSHKCSVLNGLRVRQIRRQQAACARLCGACATPGTSDADLLSEARTGLVRRCTSPSRQEPPPGTAPRVLAPGRAPARPCSGASVSWHRVSANLLPSQDSQHRGADAPRPGAPTNHKNSSQPERRRL